MEDSTKRLKRALWGAYVYEAKGGFVKTVIQDREVYVQDQYGTLEYWEEDNRKVLSELYKNNMLGFVTPSITTTSV